MMSQNQDTAADESHQEPLGLEFFDTEKPVPHDKPPIPSSAAREQPLPAHPCSGLFGKRSIEQFQQLSETMQISGGPVEVFLFDGQVLGDPDLYRAARGLGLPIKYITYSGDDPIAFMCMRVLHKLHLDKGTRAVIVTHIYPWTTRGRPHKSSIIADFLTAELHPKTAHQLARLAGVSESYIEKAKEICSFGLADLVINRKLKFGTAYRRMTDVKAAGLGGEVFSDALDFDTAWLLAREKLSAASDKRRQRDSTKRDLANRVKELESEVEELRRQLLDGNPNGRPRFLQSEDPARQLEEQRDEAIVRAEAAEAQILAVSKEREELFTEIQELRRLFREAALDAADVKVQTPAVDGDPHDHDRLVPSLSPATPA